MSRKSFSLLSFNVLAPCYFRYQGRIESNYPKLYLSRMSNLIEHVIKAQAIPHDLICLQEYWFEPTYQDLYHQHFAEDYHMQTLKRKGTKEDGIVTFVKKDKFKIEHVEEIGFEGGGDRVALLSYLSLKEDNQKVYNEYNRRLRFHQIQSILRSISSFRSFHRCNDLPILMCGDFNDVHDAVYDQVLQSDYRSVFASIYGREAKVTHCNHNEIEVGVDFIFLSHSSPSSLSLTPQSCHLFPLHVSDETALERPVFDEIHWDNKNNHLSNNSENLFHPHQTMEEFMKTWKYFSDHRPLIASFDYSSSPSSSPLTPSS